jgi:hypothetical protein
MVEEDLLRHMVVEGLSNPIQACERRRRRVSKGLSSRGVKGTENEGFGVLPPEVKTHGSSSMPGGKVEQVRQAA